MAALHCWEVLPGCGIFQELICQKNSDCQSADRKVWHGKQFDEMLMHLSPQSSPTRLKSDSILLVVHSWHIFAIWLCHHWYARPDATCQWLCSHNIRVCNRVKKVCNININKTPAVYLPHKSKSQNRLRSGYQICRVGMYAVYSKYITHWKYCCYITAKLLWDGCIVNRQLHS